MGISVNLNNRGFTLVEFLVAIVILMVGMLGLLQTVNYAISYNMNNQLQQAAILLADEMINKEKAKPFANVSSGVSPGLIRNKIEPRLVNGAFRNYSVLETGLQNSAIDPTVKNYEVQVSWKYKQQRYQHSISTLLSNQ